MKKTFLITLFSAILTLAGCTQQTSTENQNTNQPVANQNINQNLNDNQQVDAYTDWQIYTHPNYSWKIKYPKNWQVKEINQSIIFAPQNVSLENNTALTASEYIEWTVLHNPHRLSLEKFFDGINQPDYFSDAANGVENIIVDKIASKKFNGIQGMVTYTITTIPRDTIIIELKDNGEKYQDNGIYDMMVQSIDL